MFQSALTFSFSSLGTAMTNIPSRGMALCSLPELNCAKRMPSYFCISAKRNLPSNLIALARCLLISSPECPPTKPFNWARRKKEPAGAFSRWKVNFAEVLRPPAQETKISPSSSESRLIRKSPVIKPAFMPSAPVRPVSSSRVKTHSMGPCSMSSAANSASSMAHPIPSSAPSVVPSAVSHSPSTYVLMGSLSKSIS